MIKKDIIKIETLESLLKGFERPEMGEWRQKYNSFAEKSSDRDSGEFYDVNISKTSYDHPGHGMDYRVAVNVKSKDGKGIYSFGPETYRHGFANMTDDWSIAYNDAKILQEDPKGLVLALQSGSALRILDIKNDGSSKSLESYNLDRESKENSKLTSIESIVKNLDEEKFKNYMGSCVSPNHVFTYHKDDTLMIGASKPYDRDYDAKIEGVHFFVAVKDKGIGNLYIPVESYHPGARFYSINGPIEDFKVIKNKNSATFSGRIEVWYRPCSGSSRSTGVPTKQSEKNFKIKFDLKGKK